MHFSQANTLEATMPRLYILIALSLPLAAAPVLACDMELADDSVSLADLLDEVDRAGDAANAASVAGEQASKVEPSTDSEAESPVDDPPPVEEATTSVHDLLRELESRALAARPSPEDAVVTDAAVFAVEGTFEEVVVDMAQEPDSNG